MPVAVIQDATLPSQAQVVAARADFPEVVADAGLRSPAIIVIGTVVGFAAADLSAPGSVVFGYALREVVAQP